MARSSAAPLVLALAQSASADIVLSRTVNSLSAGSIKVTLDGGACASSDAYGSNQCDLDWGKSCGPTALAPTHGTTPNATTTAHAHMPP